MHLNTTPVDANTAALDRVAIAGFCAGLVATSRGLAVPTDKTGRVAEVVGSLIRVTGVEAEVGTLCSLESDCGIMQAEVVGLAGKNTLLAPFGSTDGLSRRTVVRSLGKPHEIYVGDFLLGRTIDGFGAKFLDGAQEEVYGGSLAKVTGLAPSPLQRLAIERSFHTGVRAIDGLNQLGVGQRVGIFAPAGCGKSTLLGLVARHASSDINVVALVGERGREVREFIEDTLGTEAMKRTIVVVATSDRPAIERMRAAYVATAIAEHFRARGRSVLLMLDSVTRVARAMREIGLAAGEPPTRRGFPPSVFAQLPGIFERAGTDGAGSITAFYTVLEETDDGLDPISEEVRSLLDGHLVLSRKLANSGHFPAIDVLASISRLMNKIAQRDNIALATKVRELWSRYLDVELLIQIGEYRKGEDALSDHAIKQHPEIRKFLRQALDETTTANATAEWLRKVAG
ncbi:MAG: FliI/YscN family ATPase [Casimicrobium sp.]